MIDDSQVLVRDRCGGSGGVACSALSATALWCGQYIPRLRMNYGRRAINYLVNFRHQLRMIFQIISTLFITLALQHRKRLRHWTTGSIIDVYLWIESFLTLVHVTLFHHSFFNIIFLLKITYYSPHIQHSWRGVLSKNKNLLISVITRR